jgi:hypothetical protein
MHIHLLLPQWCILEFIMPLFRSLKFPTPKLKVVCRFMTTCHSKTKSRMYKIHDASYRNICIIVLGRQVTFRLRLSHTREPQFPKVAYSRSDILSPSVSIILRCRALHIVSTVCLVGCRLSHSSLWEFDANN